MKTQILSLGLGLAFIGLVSSPGLAAAQDKTVRKQEAVESAPELPQAIDKLAEQILKALPKGKAKIAVAPFANLGPTALEKKLGQVVSELLVTRLSGNPDIIIIERGQIEQVLEELKLSMLGLTESDNAEKVGKLLGAEAMIVGSVAEIGDKFAVTARHVNVGTGKVAFAKEVQVPQAGTIALSSKYVVTRTRGDALFRSLLVPGWGQLYNQQDVKGYAFTGVTLGLIGGGVFLRMASQGTYDNEYMNATNPDDATKFHDQATSEREQSNLLFAIAGGVWVVNILDAYISGTSRTEVNVTQIKEGVQPVVATRGDGTHTAMVQYGF